MDYDVLEKGLKFALRDWKGREDRYHFPSINALTISEAAAAIADLRAWNEALCDIIFRYVDPCDVLPEDDAIVAEAVLAANKEK